MTDRLVDKLEISPHRLDRQWSEQPHLMHEACLEEADARRKERSAKDNLALVEAELKRAVRRTPERYGLDVGKRPSNDVVDDAVIVQHEYRLALQAYNDAKHEAEVRSAFVQALSHRKSALENSVILHCRGYGAECKLPQEEDHIAREKMDDLTGGRRRWKGITPTLDEDGD